MFCITIFLFIIALCDAGTETLGLNFEDSFALFKPEQWNIDHGARHCAHGLGCMYATDDNLHFVQSPSEREPKKKNELMITMRNDCDEKHCCENEHHCTSYTSGQLTSQDVYSYGTFDFWVQVDKQVEEFTIEKTSFKSVKCESRVSGKSFPSALSETPGAGYCVNHEADLEKYSSNRDLCQGVNKKICGRYTWVINSLVPGSEFHFQAAGRPVDYETSAIYHNGKYMKSGGRDLMQDFKVKFATAGLHTVELYGWEDCCAGPHQSGYWGWTLGKTGGFMAGWFGGRTQQSTSSTSGSSSQPVRDPGASINIEDEESPAVQEEEWEREYDNVPTDMTTEEIKETTPATTDEELAMTTDETQSTDPATTAVVASSETGIGWIGLFQALIRYGVSKFSSVANMRQIIMRYAASLIGKRKDAIDPNEAYFVSKRADEEKMRGTMVEKASLHELDWFLRYVSRIIPEKAPMDTHLVSLFVGITENIQVGVSDTQGNIITTPADIFPKGAPDFEPGKKIELSITPVEPGGPSSTASLDVSVSVLETSSGTPSVTPSSAPFSENTLDPTRQEEFENIDPSEADEAEASAKEHEEIQTTGELSTTSSTDHPTEVTDVQKNTAQLCVALLRMVTRYVRNILMKISMCFSSSKSKQATLVAKYGEDVYKKEVELPFDASSKVGKYSIQWLPDRVIWMVENKAIGELHHGVSPIPNSPMHIKLFIAPEHPEYWPSETTENKVVEHQLHVYSTGYTQYVGDKDELFVIGKDKTYHWRMFLLVGCLLIITLVGGLFYQHRPKKVPDGYVKLLEEEKESRILP